MVKKFVQQGRSHIDARSVLALREYGKMARTPLAGFFNIPKLAGEGPEYNEQGKGHSKNENF